MDQTKYTVLYDKQYECLLQSQVPPCQVFGISSDQVVLVQHRCCVHWGDSHTPAHFSISRSKPFLHYLFVINEVSIFTQLLFYSRSTLIKVDPVLIDERMT